MLHDAESSIRLIGFAMLELMSTPCCLAAQAYRHLLSPKAASSRATRVRTLIPMGSLFAGIASRCRLVESWDLFEKSPPNRHVRGCRRVPWRVRLVNGTDARVQHGPDHRCRSTPGDRRR